MNSLANSLSAEIDKNAGQYRDGALVSLDLDGLAQYLLVSANIAQKFVARGLIVSRGPTRRDDPNGRKSYSTADLNALRTAVLTEIVGGVIDESESPEEIGIAAPRAIREHVKSFSAQPKTTDLARDGAGRYYEDDEPGTIRQAATVGAAGAGLYAGASFLRGRASGLNPLAAIRMGHGKNVADVRKVGNYLRPRVRLVASKGAGLLDTASTAAKRTADLLRPGRQ
jgi:hypothetical protein